MKRFTKNDAGFVCKNCGFTVLPLSYTSRNHCPRCLCSLHVDINPGDRMCECHGILRPIYALYDGDGFTVVQKCDKCGAISRNRAAQKKRAENKLPDEQYDDTELLIALTAKSGDNS